MKESRIKRRSLLLITLCVSFFGMMQVCFADMGNPGGLAILAIGFLFYYLAISLALIAGITGLVLLILRLFDPKERSPLKTEEIRENVIIIAFLIVGAFLGGLLIGLFIIAYALRRADVRFRERLSYPGSARETGREWHRYIGGLTVVSAIVLWADLSFEGFADRVRGFIRIYRESYRLFSELSSNIDPYILKAILVAAVWALIVLIRTARLASAEENAKRFLFDGAAVLMYLFAGYSLSMFGGKWLWIMAIRLVVKIRKAGTYVVPHKEKRPDYHVEKDLDSWIEKLHKETGDTESNKSPKE